MTRIQLAALVMFATAMGLPAQPAAKSSKAAPGSRIIKCKGPNANPCNARQVEALSDAVFAQKSQKDYLVPLKSLTLASSDGTLKCEQSDGKPCTTQQLDAVKQIAVDQTLYLNYSTAK